MTITKTPHSGDTGNLRRQIQEERHSYGVKLALPIAVNPEISRTISARFAPTHRLETVGSYDRDPDAYPALTGLNVADRAFLLSEHRKDKMALLFARLRTTKNGKWVLQRLDP